jgi:hypothetical protein
MTATLKRRKEVLRLAQEHDFIILEGMCFFPILLIENLISKGLDQ